MSETETRVGSKTVYAVLKQKKNQLMCFYNIHVFVQNEKKT